MFSSIHRNGTKAACFYLALVPVFIVIVVVSSVLVSKNSSAPSSPTAASSTAGGTFTSTAGGGSTASSPPPKTTTTTTSPNTSRSSGTNGGTQSTAPATSPNLYPSVPSSDASPPTAPSSSPSSFSATSGTTSESDGTTVSRGPLYDESVLADHWLYAHNTRRDTFYAQHQLSPKHLKWSNELAASALNYSELLLTLLPGCTIQHGFQGNHEGGENLAMMWDTGIAVTVLPELVLQAWFDNEQHHPFGDNGHWSQVAWRGSGYLGCGIAKKIPSSGFSCYISTCRYIATGNCNMNTTNQLTVMLQDTSPCPPACPYEGC